MRWNKGNDALLIREYQLRGALWCAKRLGISPSAVAHRAHRLHLQRRGPESEPRILLKGGYIWIRAYGFQEALHRMVWEKWHKRRLKPTEILHHVDGNKLNNDPKNIQVTNRIQHPFKFH